MLELARTRLRPMLLAGLVAVLELIRMVFALRLPEGRLAGVIYDDAFYYIVCAKNFATLGRWTFDGVEPASGFHLMWGYLIAGVYWLAPGIGLYSLYFIMQLIQTACLAGAAWLSVKLAIRVFGPDAELGVALIFLSTASLTRGEMMMESSLAIFASALTLDRLCRTEGEPRAGELAGCALLGLFGMMTRSDFGLLPVVLLAMQVTLRLRRETTRGRVKAVAAALAGSVAGLAVVMLHTHWISGEWMQSSARQKFFWSRIVGFSSALMRHILLDFLNIACDVGWSKHFATFGAVLARGAGAVLILGACLALWRYRRDRRTVMLGGWIGVIAIYLFLYRFNSGEVQFWYIAHFQAPIALAAGASVASFLRLARRTAQTLVAIFCVAGIAVSLDSSLRPFPMDAPLYTAGIYLRSHPELRPAAAWNAGRIGYFSGGSVINLDGLVNDRIYPYAKSDRLFDYVRLRHIRTILDFSLMMDPQVQHQYHQSATMRQLGITDGRLQACLTAQNPTGGAVTGDPENLPVLVYHMKPECER